MDISYQNSDANRTGIPVSLARPLPVVVAPLTSGGPTGIRVQSAASTNATSVKASAGQIYTIALTNNSTIAFLKLYNKASAPTVGTDTPIATYAIPANGVLALSFNGKSFALGIAYAITNLVADADTTAVAANQITGSIEYA